MTADERLAALIAMMEEYGAQLPKNWNRERPTGILLDYDKLLRELRLIKLGLPDLEPMCVEPLNEGVR